MAGTIAITVVSYNVMIMCLLFCAHVVIISNCYCHNGAYETVLQCKYELFVSYQMRKH